MSPGRYKIFLGMAAGVGKTYRMLQEGHAEADAGRDVAIGYLEPHRREETSAQARGLEVVLRRPVACSSRPPGAPPARTRRSPPSEDLSPLSDRRGRLIGWRGGCSRGLCV